jgi:hypothetical protein
LDSSKEAAEEDILEEGGIWRQEQTWSVEGIYKVDKSEEEDILSVVGMEEEVEDK